MIDAREDLRGYLGKQSVAILQSFPQALCREVQNNFGIESRHFCRFSAEWKATDQLRQKRSLQAAI
ncbi:hypothetical protein Mapa_000632 [Marchantia paleacea]|nr:hypothetical protein Mapa_000632 [Marchantia paleacea]